MKDAFNDFCGFDGGSTEKYFPRNRAKYEAVVLNPKIDSDTATGHWILFVRQRRKLYYFDPLGRPPTYYTKSPYWKQLESSGRLVSNVGKQYQATQSARCGLYVLYVLFYLTKGYKFTAIMNRFSLSQRIKNENLVLEFYNSKRRLKHRYPSELLI